MNYLLLMVLMLAGLYAGFRLSFRYHRAKADVEVADVI